MDYTTPTGLNTKYKTSVIGDSPVLGQSKSSHYDQSSINAIIIPRIATMVRITTSSISLLMASALALKHSHPIAKRNDVETVTVPTSDDVKTALEEWEIDVNKVNTFLDGASANLNNLAQLSSDASDALNNFAMEEPKQLQTLINWFTNDPNNDGDAAPDAFNCATNDLATGQTIGNVVFNFDSLVINVFKDIVEDADAGNSDAVANLLSIVNSYRCCNVLPDLDIIWLDSASSAHLQVAIAGVTSGVATKAARPAACGAFDCSKTPGASTCATEDNGSFGAPGQ